MDATTYIVFGYMIFISLAISLFIRLDVCVGELWEEILKPAAEFHSFECYYYCVIIIVL